MSSKTCCSASRSVYNFIIIFPLQLMLYEYHCKATLEYDKEIPQEEITLISIELVMADGEFSLKFQILNCFQSFTCSLFREMIKPQPCLDPTDQVTKFISAHFESFIHSVCVCSHVLGADSHSYFSCNWGSDNFERNCFRIFTDYSTSHE